MTARSITRPEFDNLKVDVDRIGKIIDGNNRDAGLMTTIAILRDNYKTLSNDVKSVKAWEIAIFIAIAVDVLTRALKIGF
jgi:hypothetical protein